MHVCTMMHVCSFVSSVSVFLHAVMHVLEHAGTGACLHVCLHVNVHCFSACHLLCSSRYSDHSSQWSAESREASIERIQCRFAEEVHVGTMGDADFSGVRRAGLLMLLLWPALKDCYLPRRMLVCNTSITNIAGYEPKLFSAAGFLVGPFAGLTSC